MDMHQIRLLNLEVLIKKHGSAAKIANLIGSSPTVFSVIRSDRHPDKNMGNGMARRIETALSLPHGWMDQLHDEHEIVQNNHADERTITMDELEQQVLAIMKQQSPEQKEALLEIAKTLNKMS
jgi:hypothetical protein